MTRLEALKLNVYNHLMRAQNTEMAQHKALHSDTFQRSYYSNIYNIAKGFNAGINFSILPKKAIDKALSAKWLGSNYSQRVWNNNRQFTEKVQRTITDGITAGHSIDRMANKLLDYVSVEGTGQRYITERLVRTETAHFMAEGQLEAYKETGIEKYQYVASFDERTCDFCGGLDGEIIPVSEARAGDNYPPLHANCRCTTVLTGFNPLARIARNPETGKNYKVDGNMTYNQWKDSLTDEQRSAIKYVDKSIKNDIINLNRAIKRRESNIGAFQNLEVPMQKRNVLRMAKKYNISTNGLTFKIQRSEKLLALPFYGSTDYNDIGRIDLFPNAFVNEEQMVRTIIHEKCHVKQLQKHGKTYTQQNIELMEKQAERFENLYYKVLRKMVK